MLTNHFRVLGITRRESGSTADVAPKDVVDLVGLGGERSGAAIQRPASRTEEARRRLRTAGPSVGVLVHRER